MSTLPITTACYSRRIAALQQQLQRLLDQADLDHCSAEELERLELKVQPLYVAIWAMHAEINV
jgi:hypothetical protein